MTLWKLIDEYYTHHPNGHYFDHDTLKFFGETRSSMRVLNNTCVVTDCMGEKHTCYILSKVSKKFDGRKFRNYAYFDTTTFDHIT